MRGHAAAVRPALPPNVYVHAIASTQQGRVFLAGRDGCLYELAYQAEAGWFSQHCRKINHSKSSLSFLVPSMLQFTFSDDGEARRDRHFRNISRYLCGASAAEPRVRGGGLAAKPPRRLPAATNPPLHPQDGADGAEPRVHGEGLASSPPPFGAAPQTLGAPSPLHPRDRAAEPSVRRGQPLHMARLAAVVRCYGLGDPRDVAIDPYIPRTNHASIKRAVEIWRSAALQGTCQAVDLN